MMVSDEGSYWGSRASALSSFRLQGFEAPEWEVYGASIIGIAIMVWDKIVYLDARVVV